MTSERAGELILQERMRIDYKKRGANFWMVKNTVSTISKEDPIKFWNSIKHYCKGRSKAEMSQAKLSRNATGQSKAAKT